jgi:hypothetical protein
MGATRLGLVALAFLTNDRAPVDWLTDRMIVSEVEHGAQLDERSLPTAPGR